MIMGICARLEEMELRIAVGEVAIQKLVGLEARLVDLEGWIEAECENRSD